MLKNIIYDSYLVTNRTFNIIKRGISEFNVRSELIRYCEREFDLPTYKVQSLMLKWPTLQTIDEEQIKTVLDSLQEIGIQKKDVLKQPTILNVHSLTIRNRHNVLVECGFKHVNLPLISRFMTLTRKKTIGDLKRQKFLPSDLNISDNLIKCFDVWPDIQKTLSESVYLNKMTLNEIRMDLLQKCLRIKFNCDADHFKHIETIYPTIKNKPLAKLCRILHIAEDVLKYPKDKILSQGSLLTTDPENLWKLIDEVKEIGGVDIKTVLYRHPGVARSLYTSVNSIKKFFKDENISDDAQSRCLQVFTLSPQTVRERFYEIKNNPDLYPLIPNPRILQVIYYRNKVFKRLDYLQSINKKCSSLHKLVSHDTEFNRFASSFGDKTRGVDVIKALNMYISPTANDYDIKNKLHRHPFWTNIPLSAMMTTVNYLKERFTIHEIFSNCELLLYPLEDIKTDLELIEQIKFTTDVDIDYMGPKIDVKKVTNLQKLSLLLYILEKSHHFSGNGVWPKQSEIRYAQSQ